MPYGIEINVNFGNGNASFQSLIDNMNRLQGIVTDLSKVIETNNTKTTSSTSTAKKSITDYAGSYKTLTEDIKKNRAALLEQLSILTKLRAEKDKDTRAINFQIDRIKKLESAIKTQTSTLSQYNKTLGITASTAKNTNTALGSLTKTFNSLGAVLGISFGAYGAFRVLTDIIKVIADFNLSQKKLQSILGETNKGMVDVAQSAIEVGKSSIFGAKGVTELQIELAKMGFAKDEIVAMQGAIVNLATATQEELAPSAEIVANILRSFQLPAEEATKVVDIMGKAFNDSALDLANFREAIKYVSPIAKQAGFTFAETTSLLEQLSNAGIKGSLAGTGLTNIISRLGNENSKFVKTLGRTVNGFDEFLVALVELKNKGADLTDIFQLVDRRAAATFSILLDGVSTVEQFRSKLEESAGVMRDQAAVQLESLTFKTKLLKNTWEGFILSIDSGDGVLSKVLGSAVDNATSFLNILNDIVDLGQKDLTEKRLQSTLDIYQQLGLPTPEQLNNVVKSITDTRTKIGANALDIAIALATGKPSGGQAAKLIANNVNSVLDKADTEINKHLTDLVTADINVWKGAFGENWNENLSTLITSLELKNNETERGTVEFKKQSIAIRLLKLEYEAFLKTKTLTVPGAEEEDKAVQNRIKAEIDLLELQKKLAIEKVKLEEIGSGEKINIGQAELEFDKKINDKKLELAIELGEDKVLAQKKSAAEGLLIEAKFYNVLKDVWDNAVIANDKAWAEMNKNRDERFKDAAKQRSDDTKDLFDWIEEQKQKMFEQSKFKQENPIWAALGFTSDNSEFIDSLKDGFDLAKDYITGWADKWVEQTERVVDARNNAVDEAEQSLQTELQLAELGFASNVTLKRKQLEEEKILRDKALIEARKARQVQAQIDTATQLSSLLTAVANIIKGWSSIPIVGSILGIAAAGAMLASFVAFRSKAMAAASTDKYEKGGEVGGRRHSQGGTHIEAEQGEYVVNRRSTLKHKKLIEAINNDDNISLNKLYINGLKSSVLSAHVSLDDSEDLKAIRKALETKDKQVSYFGNYRIEKSGNITTRIRMN